VSHLTFARTPSASVPVDFARDARNDRSMLELLVLVGRALTLACRGHQELVLENMALRQQLRAVKRTTKRPQLRTRDRLFWIALARISRNWRTALLLVQPDTVVRWHRDWLRRRWTRCSKPRPGGRPTVKHQIRTLVREMATANPLWGHPAFTENCACSVSTSQNERCRGC
jgi:hypothetical protein